jgi:DNA-directed RNA polymerase omega subunit
MNKTDKATHNSFSNIMNEEQWQGVDSRFRLVSVAVLRAKQLLHGSRPRIDVDPKRSKNTSIALEEVKQGLVPYTINDKERAGDADKKSVEAVTS